MNQFIVWKPEENPNLFLKIRAEAWRRNAANPKLKQVNFNTWVEKPKKAS